MNTPIAVFAFNRPNHLRRTLESLTSCADFEGAPLTVFCDGPRRPDQHDAVEATRDVARTMLGASADLRLSTTNKGLANSIIGGVTELVERHGRVIVIEDDFDLAPGFLEYMNAALDRFESAPNVFQISGHMFDVPEFAARDTALFLPITTTWGWGTWARAWRAFDPAASGWQQLAADSALRRQFNLGGVFDYATMLERQMVGQRDSWGIRWYWSVFRQHGLTLFPPQSLVRNTGQDGSGTHGAGILRSFGGEPAAGLQATPLMPDCAINFDTDMDFVRQAIWRQNGGWFGFGADLAKRAIKQFRAS